MKPEISTLDYYNQNADDFITKTSNADISELISSFCSKIPQGGRILDVGCGSGRDTVYFIRHGYEVVAFDASIEVAKLASQKINYPVETLKIEDMNYQEEFDGVWAMASLLHIPKSEMKQAIENCLDALKPGGEFFLALKSGVGEDFDSNGRFFSYYHQEELMQIFSQISKISNISFDNSGDALGRDVSWLNISIKKSLQLTKKMKF